MSVNCKRQRAPAYFEECLQYQILYTKYNDIISIFKELRVYLFLFAFNKKQYKLDFATRVCCKNCRNLHFLRRSNIAVVFRAPHC